MEKDGVTLGDEDRDFIVAVVQQEVERIIADLDSRRALTSCAGGDSGPTLAGPPLDPWSSRSAPRQRGRLGVPLHALTAGVPLGAFTCALLFDLASHLAAEPYTYPRSAYWLTAIGIVAALGSMLTGSLDHRHLARGTSVASRSTKHMVLATLAIIGFLVSFALRRTTDFLGEVPLAIVGLSTVSVAVLWVATVMGARLSYLDGVGHSGVTAHQE